MSTAVSDPHPRRHVDQPKPRVYVAHASGWEYREGLYRPIRQSPLSEKYEFILPHEGGPVQYDSKRLLASGSVLILIAEVSFPSFGLGIELGWANAYGVPIGYLIQEGKTLSGSLKVLSEKACSYRDADSLVAGIERLVVEGLDEKAGPKR